MLKSWQMTKNRQLPAAEELAPALEREHADRRRIPLVTSFLIQTPRRDQREFNFAKMLTTDRCVDGELSRQCRNQLIEI